MYTVIKTDRVMKKKLKQNKVTQEDYNTRMSDIIEGIVEDLKNVSCELNRKPVTSCNSRASKLM